MKNEVVLKKCKAEKTFLNTIKARKITFIGYFKRYDSIMKNIVELAGGGQKIMRQTLGSMALQHQGMVRAQLSRVYETSQSTNGVTSDFQLTLVPGQHHRIHKVITRPQLLAKLRNFTSSECLDEKDIYVARYFTAYIYFRYC